MKKAQEQLIQAGYRLTKPRLGVLRCLAAHHGSLSAQALHDQINEFDRASVYRTLNLLEDLRIVNTEIINKEKVYCLAGEPHHHIICKKCGYMEKIKCDHAFGQFKNFKNVFHQLTLTGVCNRCEP